MEKREKENKNKEEVCFLTCYFRFEFLVISQNPIGAFACPLPTLKSFSFNFIRTFFFFLCCNTTENRSTPSLMHMNGNLQVNNLSERILTDSVF